MTAINSHELDTLLVGSTAPIAVDVRVIAATNADLDQQIRDRTFREDLYYRLNVLPTRIPLLREIKDDISLIAEHLLIRLNQECGRQMELINTGQ